MAIQKIGTITKNCYCNKCFSAISYDDPAEERTVFGNRVVICPECGSNISIADVGIEVKQATIDDRA